MGRDRNGSEACTSGHPQGAPLRVGVDGCPQWVVLLQMNWFSLAGEGGLEESVEGADDLEVLGAAGFGFGAAVDPVAPAAHDDDVEGRAFVASVDGHVLELAGAGEDLLDAAEAVGVAVDEGVLAAFDAEFVGALTRI